MRINMYSFYLNAKLSMTQQQQQHNVMKREKERSGGIRIGVLNIHATFNFITRMLCMSAYLRSRARVCVCIHDKTWHRFILIFDS